MAQDFAAAFGLGGDERVIDPIDAQGVALAAVKALIDKIEVLEARVAALEGGEVSRSGEGSEGEGRA